LRSPAEDENARFVMPARTAGIQVRMDASGHPCRPGFQPSMLE
jgi:hypothetical protein